MLRRKIETKIEDYLTSDSNKILVVDGARQIGKSFIIRHVGQKLFANYIEINMEKDKQRDRLFADANSVESFYLALSAIAGDKMHERENTLIFIDEIQAYDHLMTLVKFLKEDNRYTYIASGSLLGVTLKKTQSIPVGSLSVLHMYPLDFEEFLWANGVGEMVIDEMRRSFESRSSLPNALHQVIMGHFRRYLLVGGLPDAVNTYLADHNIVKVREVQTNIYSLYIDDAAKYEQESLRKLKIQRIYQMVPSNMESRKKRIVVKDIEYKTGKRTSDYQNEFDYLISAGVVLDVNAISKPSYPLVQNAGKNLLKLYINDIGMLTNILYRNNIKPILEDIASINLGAVYETLVAQELKAHGYSLFYYDNKKNGEVDFLIDDSDNLTTLPLEIKSGKDYTVHSALSHFVDTSEYNIHQAFVLSNESRIFIDQKTIYMPIYNIMFFDANRQPDQLYF
ncbi:MAG: ATP-binding protein [Bacteroidales bacterium]|nr:ATP-binding protein [Candidatus Liminaster caballi]